MIQIIITARKRNLREGNVFSHVCLFVQRRSPLPLLPYGDPPTSPHEPAQTCSLRTSLPQLILAHEDIYWQVSDGLQLKGFLVLGSV